MASDTKTVHNAPAGGDQSQASTNDDNINDVLTDKPYVVAISDGDTVGVVARFSDQGAADASAKAFKAKRPQKRIELKVVKENDPKAGLPALVAEVEADKMAAEEEDNPDAAESDAAKSDAKPAAAKPAAR